MLAAGEIARHLGFADNVHVTAREGSLTEFGVHPVYGEVYRLDQSPACRLLFRKISRLDIPIIVHAHSVRSFRADLGVADRYLAVSSFTRDQLIANGFPADKIEVVPNGADSELFSPADEAARQGLRTALGLPMACFVVAYVGRKQAAKGFVTFPQTVEALAARGLHVCGLCAGPIPADTLREDGYAQREALPPIADRQGTANRYAGAAASTIGQCLSGRRCAALRVPIQVGATPLGAHRRAGDRLSSDYFPYRRGMRDGQPSGSPAILTITWRCASTVALLPGESTIGGRFPVRSNASFQPPLSCVLTPTPPPPQCRSEGPSHVSYFTNSREKRNSASAFIV